MKKSLLTHFGIEDVKHYESSLFKQIRADLVESILHRQMIAISGAIGTGKSTLFNAAVRSLKESRQGRVQFVYVRNFFKEHLTIAGILNAIIMDLSGESPRRDLEARSRQVIRIMGELRAHHKANICIVIEEAHRLHFATLRALKELREASFAGYSPLFSVALIGHEQLASKLRSSKEVFWRSQLTELNESQGWMTFEDRIEYLRVRFDCAIDPEARGRIAALTTVPLEMDFFVEERMEQARAAGKHYIDGECVQLSSREIKDRLGLSNRDIAEAANLGRSTVSQAISGLGSEESQQRVQDALNRMLTDKLKVAV